MRFGIGYDVHKLVEGRDFILGGVRIDYPKGLDGHSDADVLLHSIMDALLGAVASRDIGHHFPDTDLKYKGADSLMLLDKVDKILLEEGYKVNNLDTTILCQKPKLASFIPKMIYNIARCLDVPENCVNVKATTTEGLGFVGKEEGIAVMSIASVVPIDGR
ncbi:MAG: 2-C-methyl-D-erythritol 2,4-cyclodiphosphate synthase [Desulfitibacter sp. BRH_c19]|nr:MAG: 2-C-methyl-D-erythritol 2,4-cyclodiphosphate synthase [Desulfitibacter sp. BRH_c19]